MSVAQGKDSPTITTYDTPEERELADFRKWLERQKKKDESSVLSGEGHEDDHEQLEGERDDLNVATRTNNPLEHLERAVEREAILRVNHVKWRGMADKLWEEAKNAEEQAMQRFASWDDAKTASLTAIAVEIASCLKGLKIVQAEQQFLLTQSSPDKMRLVFLAAEFNSIKKKLERVTELREYGKKKLTLPEQMDDTKRLTTNLVEAIKKRICANKDCARSKIDHNHPLCRTCQTRFRNGEIDGSWARR